MLQTWKKESQQNHKVIVIYSRRSWNYWNVATMNSPWHTLVLWKNIFAVRFKRHHIRAFAKMTINFIRIIWLNTLDYFRRVWSLQRTKNGRSLFIWQREIHSSWSDSAIACTIREKYCTRCGGDCEVHIFGDFYHIKVAVIHHRTAFVQRYSISKRTGAISPDQFFQFNFFLEK